MIEIGTRNEVLIQFHFSFISEANLSEIGNHAIIKTSISKEKYGFYQRNGRMIEKYRHSFQMPG